MASVRKTQIRIGQISGSIPQANESAAASTSLAITSLSGTLNHIASAIKRIHGAATFTAAASGEFSSAITPASNDGGALGSASKSWSDVFVASGGVINFDNGNLSLTHSANALTLSSTDKLQFTDANAYINHDGTDLQIVDDADINIKPAVDFLVDAGGDIILDADGDQIDLKFGGASGQLQFGNANSGDVTMSSRETNKDLVILGDDDAEIARFVGNGGDVKIGGGAGSSGVTITTGGQVTADGRMIVDDSTEATTTTDGSLQTDGGLSVAKSAVIGDDLDLLSNSAIFKVGSDQPFTLTHSNANNTLLASSGHRLAFGDAGDYIHGDGTDIEVVGSADIKLSAAAFVEVPANIPLAFDGTGHDDKISSDGTDMTIAVGGGDIVLDASDDIIIDAGGDMVDFKKAGTLHASFDMSSGGDLIVKDAGGTEIFRIDGSADSLLMAGTKKIEFNDATQFIQGNSNAELQISATDEINLDATTIDINGDADISGALAVGGALTVTGDLTVLGSATEISSSNTIIKDALIVLNSSSYGDGTPISQDAGLVFAQPDVSRALFVDQSDSLKFKFVTTYSSGSATSITPIDGAVVAVGKLEIDGGNDYLDVDTDLKIVAAADIVLDPGGNNVVPGSNNADALGAAGTAWSDLFLGDGGVVNFKNGDVTMTHANNLLNVEGGNLRAIRLEIDSAADYIDVSTDLQVVAAADIELNAGGGNVKPHANDGSALGVADTAWSDLFLASGAVVNFNNGDVTATHSANLLAIAGGNTRVERLEIDSANDYIDVDTDLKLVAAADIILDPAGSDVKVDGNMLPNSADGGALGGSSNEWSDLYLADGSKVYFGADQDIVLNHSPDRGLILTGSHTNGTNFAIDNTAGDGDSAVVFQLSGITKWSVGVEDGDNDKFVIENGTGALGAAPAMEITSAGQVSVMATTNATSTTDGALYSAGGLSVAADAVVGDDLKLKSDSAVIHFGAGEDVTLTHTNDVGLHLNAGMRLGFRDQGGEYLTSVSDGNLAMVAATSLDLKSPQIDFGEDDTSDVTLNFLGSNNDGQIVWDESLDLFKMQDDVAMETSEKLYFRDTGLSIHSSEDGQLDIASDGTMVDSILMNASAGGIKLSSALDNAASIHLSGYGITLTGNDQNDSIYLENSPLKMEQISEPSSTGDKLYNVSGDLFWAGNAFITEARYLVASSSLTVGVTSGSALSGSTQFAGETSAEAAPFSLSLASSVTDSSLGKSMNVFVNGQLMFSGSNANVGTGAADYHVVAGGASDRTMIFGFDLHVDDVVQVVVR